MKKIIAMAALVLSSVGAFAQYSAGDFTLQPKVGLNCSSLTEDDADYKAGFVGGLELEYHVSPLIVVSAEVSSTRCKDARQRMLMISKST